MPGWYVLSINHDGWCWDKKTIDVEVGGVGGGMNDSNFHFFA